MTMLAKFVSKFLPLLIGACVGFAARVSPGDDVDPIVKASPYADKTVWSYHDSQPLPWKRFHPNDFASIPVKFDGTGARSVGNVPAPGVHPRIFFSPEDLPAIRKRIKETRAGREAWKNVLAYSHTLKLTYDEKADYAQPDWMKGGFGVRGRAPVFRIGGYGKREDYYAKLVAGQTPDKWPDSFFGAAGVEALRCLIDDDAEGAKTLAKAMMTAVRIEQDRRAKEDKPVETGQPPKPSTSRLNAINIGFVYDFIFNWLTAEQKKTLHDELVLLSAWNDNYGTFNNADTSRSNWATFSYWVFDLLAIEGEPGFNDLKFRGFYRGWRNFMTTSYFQSGAVFEGEGKSLLGMDAVVGFDRLAKKYQLDPLSHHPTIRQHFANFTANSVLPSQDKFVIFDILGSMGGGVCTPVDVVVAHYLYPEDKRLDFVYRVVVGDDYERLPNRCDWTWNMVVISALFATDYNPANTAESLGLPMSFFCGQRAVMMARSGWDKDATLVTMHVRGASGGHPYADRNGIMLAGKGRTWATIPGHGGETAGWKCGNVVIDGKGQSNTTPGRVVDYVDGPLATFIVGDAKYCWDWVWGTANGKNGGGNCSVDDVKSGNVNTGAGWKMVEQSFNDFAWTKQVAVAYDRPLKLSPDWLKVDGAISPVVRQPNLPVLRAFRTTGIVRGPRPYVLVVDDIERDGLPAKYDWNLTLPEDVVQIVPPKPAVDEVLLAGKGSLTADGKVKGGEPMLLVKLLDIKGKQAAAHVGKIDDVNLFRLSTRAAVPDFKIMLYPFRAGEPLPSVKWNDKRTEAKIEFSDQKDVIRFEPADTVKCDITITRDGAPIVAVNRPIAKFNDPESDRLTEQLRGIPEMVAALKGFQPDQLPGFVVSWSFDEIKNNGFPGSRKEAPPIPAPGGKTEPGVIGNAGRLAEEAVVPVNLKAGFKDGYTIAFWIKADPKSGGSFFTSNHHMGLTLDLVHGKLRYNTQGQWFRGGTNYATVEDWTHLAATCDGKTESLYRDGIKLMTLPLEKKLDFGPSFSISRDKFQGLYDDLRIYDRGLDDAAIAKIYLWGKHAGTIAAMNPTTKPPSPAGKPNPAKR